ncbi:MAG: hypothetical protein HWE20_01905 [Gammaproteobacteria bacterium]|nr:hypothetical protein [Gammaproteobacteria bacterium]
MSFWVSASNTIGQRPWAANHTQGGHKSAQNLQPVAWFDGLAARHQRLVDENPNQPQKRIDPAEVTLKLLHRVSRQTQ